MTAQEVVPLLNEAPEAEVGLLVRFAGLVLGEALGRRQEARGGLPFSAKLEAQQLLGDLRDPYRSLGLEPGGEAQGAERVLERALQRGSSALSRLERGLGLDASGKRVLRLLLAWSIEPRVAVLFGHVHDALQATRPTHGALAEVLRDPIGVVASLAPGAPLKERRVVLSDRYGPDALLSIDPRIVWWVTQGELPPLERSAGRLELDRSPALDEYQTWAELRRGRGLVVMRGPRGAGRTQAARALAAAEGRALLSLQLRLGGSDPEELLAVALRDARTLGARLLVRGALEPAILDHLSRAEDVDLIVALDPEVPLPDRLFDRRVLVEALEVPNAAIRRDLWSRLTGRPETDPEVARVAERFAFTPGTIRRAARQADPRSLEEACRLQLSSTLDRLRVRRAERVGWDRLVLPAVAMDTLRGICAQVEQRGRVEDEWGFGTHHRTGRGVKALFFGKPGTGKTLAAEIIADALDLPLLRIDVSQVVSKWIGETEKNLAQLFDEAKQANAILFFDEADSLFTKRTAVASSTDRYANLEVSYLLQRVEEHDGVLILATNLKANLDAAFARRLHFAVEFPEPDAAARERIWRLSFPPSAPVCPRVSFADLARRFELPGGAIRNVVSGAAYLAAAEQRDIEVSHIARALRREYSKMDRLYQRGELDALVASAS